MSRYIRLVIIACAILILAIYLFSQNNQNPEKTFTGENKNSKTNLNRQKSPETKELETSKTTQKIDFFTEWKKIFKSLDEKEWTVKEHVIKNLIDNILDPHPLATFEDAKAKGYKYSKPEAIRRLGNVIHDSRHFLKNTSKDKNFTFTYSPFMLPKIEYKKETKNDILEHTALLVASIYEKVLNRYQYESQQSIAEVISGLQKLSEYLKDSSHLKAKINEILSTAVYNYEYRPIYTIIQHVTSWNNFGNDPLDKNIAKSILNLASTHSDKRIQNIAFSRIGEIHKNFKEPFAHETRVWNKTFLDNKIQDAISQKVWYDQMTLLETIIEIYILPNHKDSLRDYAVNQLQQLLLNSKDDLSLLALLEAIDSSKSSKHFTNEINYLAKNHAAEKILKKIEELNH